MAKDHNRAGGGRRLVDDSQGSSADARSPWAGDLRTPVPQGECCPSHARIGSPNFRRRCLKPHSGDDWHYRCRRHYCRWDHHRNQDFLRGDVVDCSLERSVELQEGPASRGRRAILDDLGPCDPRESRLHDREPEVCFGPPGYQRLRDHLDLESSPGRHQWRPRDPIERQRRPPR
ncbi:hypothetical protein DVH05_007570 [Phytophthora capsici]|nr:hypothetical protein DVH05_007570 [Phytophthora capsici]